MSSDNCALLARIEELERRVAQLTAPQPRRAPWATYALSSLVAILLLFVLTAPGWVSAQDDKKPMAQEITCRKLTIVDAAGKARIVLDFNDKGGLVRVLNAEEKNIAVIDNDAIGGTMRLFGNNEKRLFTVGANKDGCQVNACDPDGKVRAYLGVDKAKEGYLSLRNKDDKTILYAAADGDGGLVRAYGHDGKQRAFFGVGDKQGDGLIMLYGTDGKWRHTLTSFKGNVSHIMYAEGGVMQHQISGGERGAIHAMMSKDGKNLISIVGASGDTGEGILRLNSTKGKTQAFLGANRNGSGGLMMLNTPDDSSRVVLGIDGNGVGFGEGRDADNAVRRSMRP